MKEIITKVVFYVGRIFAMPRVLGGAKYLYMYLYSGYVSRQISVKDKTKFTCDYPVYVNGGKYIRVHSGHLRKGCRISAIYIFNGKKYNPSINIGKNLNLGINSHIGALREIEIGDNFLTGANCLITDHTHGGDIIKEANIPPVKRELYSKGPVIIGKNVFMGENSIILPNVRIGDNVVIGASTVVTKDIPSNSVAVGNPMRIIQKN